MVGDFGDCGSKPEVAGWGRYLPLLLAVVWTAACVGGVPPSLVSEADLTDTEIADGVEREAALEAARTALGFNDAWGRLAAERRWEVMAIVEYDNPGAPGLLVDIRLVPPPRENVGEGGAGCDIPGELIGFRRLVGRSGRVEATEVLYTGGSCLG